MSSWKQCSVESLWRGSAVHPAYIRAIFRHLRTSAETKVLDKSWLMNWLTFECEMAHMHNSKAEAERTGESHCQVSKWREETNWWRSWEKVKRTHEYSVYVKQGDVHFKHRRTNVETQEDIISFPAYYGQITIKVSSLQCGVKCLSTTIVYDWISVLMPVDCVLARNIVQAKVWLSSE